MKPMFAKYQVGHRPDKNCHYEFDDRNMCWTEVSGPPVGVAELGDWLTSPNNSYTITTNACPGKWTYVTAPVDYPGLTEPIFHSPRVSVDASRCSFCGRKLQAGDVLCPGCGDVL